LVQYVGLDEAMLILDNLILICWRRFQKIWPQKGQHMLHKVIVNPNNSLFGALRKWTRSCSTSNYLCEKLCFLQQKRFTKVPYFQFYYKMSGILSLFFYLEKINWVLSLIIFLIYSFLFGNYSLFFVENPKKRKCLLVYGIFQRWILSFHLVERTKRTNIHFWWVSC